MFRACLVHFFWSLNFHHSSLITQFPSLITHYSPLITLNTKVVWYHHSVSITHYFSYYLGAPRLSQCSFFFLSKHPETWTQWKKKKPVKKTEPSEEERKKKTQWRRPNQWERRRKKKVIWSKDAAEWVPHVCLITKMSLSYE